MNIVLSTVSGLQTESVMFGWASMGHGYQTLDHIKKNFKFTLPAIFDTITEIFLSVIKGVLTYTAMTYACPPLIPIRSIGLIGAGWLAILLADQVPNSNSLAQFTHSLLVEGGRIGIFSGCLLTMVCAAKFLGGA